MKKSILKVVHESAKGLYDAGLLEAETMRTFDALCLPPVHELSPRQIQHLLILLNQDYGEVGIHIKGRFFQVGYGIKFEQYQFFGSAHIDCMLYIW